MPTEAELAARSLAEMSAMIASGLLKGALHAANQAFNDGKFRKLCDWQKLDEEEQNRIFNELVVTAIGFLDLRLDDDLVGSEAIPIVQSARKAISPAYDQQLKTMGVPRQFVRQWRKLLKLRLAEYRTDLKEHGGEFQMAFAAHAPDEPLLAKQILARVEIVAIDGLDHIRRGKLDPKDRLYPYLKRWLIALSGQLQPAFDTLRTSENDRG